MRMETYETIIQKLQKVNSILHEENEILREQFDVNKDLMQENQRLKQQHAYCQSLLHLIPPNPPTAFERRLHTLIEIATERVTELQTQIQQQQEQQQRATEQDATLMEQAAEQMAVLETRVILLKEENERLRREEASLPPRPTTTTHGPMRAPISNLARFRTVSDLPAASASRQPGRSATPSTRRREVEAGAGGLDIGHDRCFGRRIKCEYDAKFSMLEDRTVAPTAVQLRSNVRREMHGPVVDTVKDELGAD